MAKVAILGYGVVGSGVYEILASNSDNIANKAGSLFIGVAGYLCTEWLIMANMNEEPSLRIW